MPRHALPCHAPAEPGPGAIARKSAARRGAAPVFSVPAVQGGVNAGPPCVVCGPCGGAVVGCEAR
ncbi:hypothetical protein caldi_03060 [Caldinitratiruptor microaerophilus]|uniref:Uncharacterized protein n=1 Tax=Caldinitratiruptor microaerophilus TaxID=671077 RepID=A0AA35CKX2_9FIRM|nr:hypothetical protein caldi_03060 [Caldinitratiruptor microaerophilus]